jgi:hypothetical protein
MATLIRPYLSYTGNIRFIPYEICRCERPRGIFGGVCGCCGDAIPNHRERERLNRLEDAMVRDPKYDPNKDEEEEEDEQVKKHDEATKDDLVKEDQEDTEEVEQNT